LGWHIFRGYVSFQGGYFYPFQGFLKSLLSIVAADLPTKIGLREFTELCVEIQALLPFQLLIFMAHVPPFVEARGGGG